ncbi:MAG: phosphatase PAP2 family protein [Chloroflexota bacterium]
MTRRYVLRLRRPRFRGIRTPVVTARQSAGRLALLGIGSAALVVFVWAGTTQTLTGQQIADLVLYGRFAADRAVLGAASETLAAVSLPFVAIAVLGLATIAFARGGFGLVIAAVALLGGANFTAQGLEFLLERPNLLGNTAYATGNSFPSGHVALVASLGLAAALVAPRRLRTPVAVAAAILVAAVGASTIAAGWHRLADVAGAILISLAWASLVTAVLVLAQGWIPRRTWGHGLGGRATALAGGAGAVAVIAGAAGIALAIVDPTPFAELIKVGSSASGTFVAALAIAAGTSLIACAAYVWAMRGVALELPG